ncbi:MAG: CBS domain-containing protein, partial [Cyanobacteria bacterium J06639_14]
MDRHPLCVTPDRSLLDVVTLMSQRSPDNLLASESSTSISPTAIAKRSSFALVIDDDQLVGIITERDVVRLTAQGVSFAQILVTDVMTRNVTTLHESEIQDAFHVLNLFRRQRIRHVPVVDDQSQVVGVLTQTDLHNSLQATDLLKLRQVGEVMSSQVISAPPEATVLQLAEQMKTHRVSCVVIVESESIPQASSSIVRPLGIVTERDIVQFQALELTL